VSLILDASVAAKWFNFEELSERAVEFKQAFVEGDVEFAAPTHIIYEVGNSIWKNPQLTDRDASDAIVSLTRLGLDLLQPTIERSARVMEIARTKRTTFYDAAYLQAAEELKRTLLTADQAQVAAAKGIAKIIHLKDAKL
jgi:predicted nucleic acid-binding protein